MRTLVLSSIISVSLLSGCASTPAPNPWADLTVETDPATIAIDCGSFPLPSAASETSITYDIAGTNALEAYRLCSEANEANVDEHASQIGQLKFARRGLVEAGQAQRRVSDLKGEILEEERRHMFWERLGLWAIVLAGIAL